MRLVRVSLVIISLGLVVRMHQPARAQDNKDAQISAARADALESLKGEVVTVHLTPDVTIQDILDRAGGNEELDETLRNAEQLGGARWLGDQAVQIRLSINGGRVGKTLLKIVQSHPDKSPISPDELEHAMQQLAGRTFSATGTSTGAGDIGHLRPPASDRAWWNVQDADRRAAITAARNNAVSRVMDQLAGIPLGGQTLGKVIAESATSDAVKTWLENQPVKAVEFDDSLSVRLTLAAPADELWPLLRSAIEHQKRVAPPSTQAQWDQLQAAVTARVGLAQGVGTVQSGSPPAVVPASLVPTQAPPWATQEIEVEENSPDQGGRLRTARRAEALALEKLRHQVDGLPLSAGMTVGTAADQDPRIERNVVHALARARPVKVDYEAKGAVTVHVAFRLWNLWAQLSGQE